eukprot:CAMPEP_0115197138 /NCGR_PEP_ID=MMETSP0270-20121206/15444_1 /TAXON_ID=71861 /ORGANISM="Scrippsiella trochoidea, Strain CCMP3099" /LENGTH=341 /DNA_ID=CAMNT_0002610487 /DNA_START=42 /DNA_END=1067 /DNA_ORIENTATION=-
MCKGEQQPQLERLCGAPQPTTDQRKAVLITGIDGQLGSYLTELLLVKGYEVHGLLPKVEGTVAKQVSLLDHVLDHIKLHACDHEDPARLEALLQEVRPVEIYNLEVNCVPSCHLLSAACGAGLAGSVRYVEAPWLSDAPSNSDDRSVEHYRKVDGMFAVSCVLCSHESPRCRGGSLARRITSAVARVVAGLEERIELVSLDQKRDWGHARDYAQAVWLSLQQPDPEDAFIVAGEPRTVRDFCSLCFELAGRSLEWRGSGTDEVGVDSKTGAVLVSVSEELPHAATPVDFCLSDSPREAAAPSPRSARDSLGWKPEVCFKGLARTMLEQDCLLLGARLPAKA